MGDDTKHVGAGIGVIWVKGDATIGYSVYSSKSKLCAEIDVACTRQQLEWLNSRDDRDLSSLSGLEAWTTATLVQWKALITDCLHQMRYSQLEVLSAISIFTTRYVV